MASIDYGLGTTNIDHATGIRYGVISQNEVLQAWADSSEAQYGEPHCPKCGNEAVNYDEEKHDEFEANSKYSCADYACENCQLYLDSSDVFSDEALGFTFSSDGYEASQDSYGDIFITKSPFYTLCGFCSPCAPGAGYLMNFYSIDEANEKLLDKSGYSANYARCADLAGYVRAYCFGHDWFEDGRAPYRVFRVADDTEVLPDAR